MSKPFYLDNEWARFMSYIALLCMSRKYVQLLSFARCTIGKYITLSSELSNSVKKKKHSTQLNQCNIFYAMAATL